MLPHFSRSVPIFKYLSFLHQCLRWQKNLNLQLKTSFQIQNFWRILSNFLHLLSEHWLTSFLFLSAFLHLPLLLIFLLSPPNQTNKCPPHPLHFRTDSFEGQGSPCISKAAQLFLTFFSSQFHRSWQSHAGLYCLSILLNTWYLCLEIWICRSFQKNLNYFHKSQFRSNSEKALVLILW